MKISSRKKEILKQVIINFIEKAEPVSSQMLAEILKNEISSATIRKEMADLEEMGFLSHPHTSSGRIPTDTGYRYYIDNVIFNDEKSLVEQRNQFGSLNLPVSRDMDLDTILQLSTEALSKFTNYLSMIVAPEINQSKFRHIELLKFDSDYLFVLITDSGRVYKKRFNIEGGYNDLDLQRVTNILNTQARGKIIKDISFENTVKITENDKYLVFLINKIINLIKSCEENLNSYNRIFIRGTFSIFKNPEFLDFNKVKKIIDVLENEYLLMKILSNYSNENEINVKIGDEIYGSDTNDLSLVSSKYKVKGSSAGSIGVLGPKRMNYLKVISILSKFSNTLTELLNYKT
ncbi:MAG: heat-inducible transcriptional repressor HrcA [Actinobacteria bacterium]|nr:heat-inducible transcriptional repressor HrcA [Cyanobacteriota bacterium]MCL5772616.1 heat-inducible transcriptional repressor HrcA [Actinomycetota bacterium]